ncbi:hypothetical protein E2C01_071778 [Portunus trituberculatus]|uniref:Uncharacterized protein n=1 Tax=Portunus trituberculatus TaxID=210409 RepID=A0A5B7I5Y3_PORTR|nr:hypothetical protein [Portunus trituberculatus]
MRLALSFTWRVYGGSTLLQVRENHNERHHVGKKRCSPHKHIRNFNVIPSFISNFFKESVKTKVEGRGTSFPSTVSLPMPRRRFLAPRRSTQLHAAQSLELQETPRSTGTRLDVTTSEKLKSLAEKGWQAGQRDVTPRPGVLWKWKG